MKGSSKCESIWDSKNLIIFWLTELFVFTCPCWNPWCTRIFWVFDFWPKCNEPLRQTACLLGTWKLPNTLQKHPSLLSSKHSTSALYFCALWYVILDLYSSCWIKDVANSVYPTWVLSKSPLSRRKTIFTFALSGRWEDNTLVRNRWSVAGSNKKALEEHPWLRESYCKSWLPVIGVLWQCFCYFRFLLVCFFLKAPYII